MKNFILLFQFLLLFPIFGQQQLSNYIFNDVIYSVLPDSEGGLIVGGSFTSIGHNLGKAVKMNTSTAEFSTSDLRFEGGTVQEIIPIPGGGWYVGGEFTSVNGISRNRLARVNADGTLHSFNPNITDAVYALAIASDGSLYVGGSFNSVEGGLTGRGKVAKYNSSGVLQSFNPQLNNQVEDIAIDGNGNVYLGGWFSTVNSGADSRTSVAKYDVNDVLLSFNIGANNVVLALATDSQNNLYIGGWFTNVSGGGRNYLAKYDSNGNLDPFHANLSMVAMDLCVDASDNLYVGGGFSTVNGGADIRNKACKFNAAGVLQSFDPNINANVHAISVTSDGSVFIGGDFTTVSGGTVAREKIVKYNEEGDLTSFNPIMNNNVRAIAVNDNNEVYVGGLFTSINAVTRNRAARFNTDGSIDSWNPNFNGTVNVIVRDAVDDIHVGGNFTTVNGGADARGCYAKFTAVGTLQSFNPNFNNGVNKIIIDENENIYVGGWFTAVDGGLTTRNYLAKYDNTLILTAFNPHFNSGVRDMALNSNNDLYVIGLFTTVNAGSDNRKNLAVFNSSGVLQALDAQFSNAPSTIAIDSEDNVYIGGDFNTVDNGATIRYNMLKYDNTNTITAFHPHLNGMVFKIIIDEFDNVYASGNFSTVFDGTETRNRIAKFNKDGSLDCFATSLDGNAYAIALDDQHKIIAGGVFTQKLVSIDNMKGAGTLTNPFEISTTADLLMLSSNSCYWNKHFKQTADINASVSSAWNSGKGFNPIGNNINVSFQGSYDGQGYKIDGLTINRPTEDFIGLFGKNDGTIQNIQVSNANIIGQFDVGAIVGYNEGTINESFSLGSVSGLANVGGFSGENDGAISNCYSGANVTGEERVGGFIGYNGHFGGNISKCYSFGSVTGTVANFGGFCGDNDEDIIDCFYDEVASTQSDEGKGEPRSEEHLQDQALFATAGWDFSTIWKMGQCSNNDYPVLDWQTIHIRPTITGTTPASRCGSGSVVLSAQADAGDVKWYLTETGTFLMKTGEDFTTPNLIKNRNYWVEADDAGCKSLARTQVRVKIEDCISEINPNYCNTTISSFNDFLSSIIIDNATNYEYEAFDGVNTLSFVKGSANVGFKMANYTGVKYQTTYQVRVRAYVYGAWQDWSSYCNITTPKSKVKDNFCGQTVANLNTFLSVYPVANATNYEYEAFDGVNTLTFQKGNGDLTFRMSLFPNVQYNKSYEVRVRPYVNNAWGNWSDYCTINTPTLREGSAENNQIIAYLEAQNFEIQIYPNPNNGTFTISSESEGTFQITNELGQLVKTIELTKNINQDGVSFQNFEMRLKPGVYFVSGFVNGENVTKKIIVQ
jgi:hypothetical protein